MNIRLLVVASLTLSTAFWGMRGTAYGQTSMTVPNFSFEINPGNCNQCQNNTSAVPDWSITNLDGGFSNNSGAALFSASNFNSLGSADGSYFAYMNLDPANPTGYTATITSAASVTTIAPGIYTLTVAIGKNTRSDTNYGATGDIRLSLLDASNNAVLASTLIPNDTEPVGTFTDYTTTFATSGVGVGDGLLIQMSSTDTQNGLSFQPGFDNVRLDFLAVPEPSTVAASVLLSCALAAQILRRQLAQRS